MTGKGKVLMEVCRFSDTEGNSAKAYMAKQMKPLMKALTDANEGIDEDLWTKSTMNPQVRHSQWSLS